MNRVKVNHLFSFHSSQCHNFIYGIGMQGYKCTGCRTVVHKKCHQNVKSKCKSIKSTLFDESSENKTCINCPHQFEEHHFMVGFLLVPTSFQEFSLLKFIA